MPTYTVWFHARCSKCRELKSLLEERGVEAVYRHYLDQPPTEEELRELMALLGLEDPLGMMREKEAKFAELGLAEATAEERLAALREHPELLQRPILVDEEKKEARIARPPDVALDLLV